MVTRCVVWPYLAFNIIMETSIHSFIRTNSGLKVISLFGYTSKALPGLEIHGLGVRSKLIREKMIYVTRKRKMKMPLLRYCLCLDTQMSQKELAQCDLSLLEIPFLLMFWHLAGLLPIRKLDDCLAAGRFNTKGELFFESVKEETSLLSIGVGESVEASLLLEDIEDLRCA